jgi:SAM-dependent methyltransferase
VDVGCGAGTAVRDLASYVAPGGSAIGVDFGPPFIEAATARAAKAGVDVAFHVANAEELPFASESLDGYRAERVYQHLVEPTKALAEARRVLAPGGRIVLVDQDWDATLIDSDDKATTRLILRAFADGIVNSAVGRQYHRRLGDAGFSDVVIHAEAATSTNWDDYGFLIEWMVLGLELRGELNSALVQPWLEEQRERARRGRFFMIMTHFLATARR